MKGDLVQSGNATPVDDDDTAAVTAIGENGTEVDKFSVSDVVLPLPGFDVRLPDNVVAQWYRDLLARDGLSMDELRHRVK